MRVRFLGTTSIRSIRRGLATTTEARNMHMIILGAPGAGKGTQTERILKRYDMKTVGTGDLLRAEINKGSSVGKQAEDVMKAGGLLPDAIVLKVIEPELRKLSGVSWILDGFPRKASQAVLLDQFLGEGEAALNLVVNLAVPDEVILSRIEERWIHRPSGRTYNNSFNPPKKAGIDDETGEALEKRLDDTAEIFAKRLESYHAENDPLLEHYRTETVTSNGKEVPKLVTLAGKTSDEITPKLLRVIEERFPDLRSAKL